MGLGETIEDRIDMALVLRELGVKSIPVNMLNPIPGTPYAENARLNALQALFHSKCWRWQIHEQKKEMV